MSVFAPQAAHRGRRQSKKSTGVARDDSDDELGIDDLPWEWIFKSNDADASQDHGDDAQISRKRRRANPETQIVGARMGQFECHVGDCVLLKAEGSNEAWVAIVCEFLEEEDGEKAANFMWFSTEKEIRNKERKRSDFLPAAIADGSGSCIYIAGTPGTGKTATVREVISRLEDSVKADELDDFIFVEINGMKITDPHQSYTLLWEALKGERVSPTQAIDLLEREFNNPSPRRTPCVVLMDELDQLVTKNQSVMYNFFNWPGLRHSRLIVLAVANTMDLPERTLSNKISSRIGYNHEQLMKIIQSRLECVPGSIVEADAIQFASRKVAAVSGDARRALDICRRAVELAEGDSRVETHAGDPEARRSTPSKGKTADAPVKVTIATIKRAINEATTNPVQQYLRSLPFGPKLLLSSLLVRIQRNGTGETTFGDVVDELHRIIKLDTATLESTVLSALSTGPSGGDVGQGNDSIRIVQSLALPQAALELVGAGIIVLEAHKPERPSKVRLAVGDEEVKMAFRDDGEVKALGLFF
ncbi:Origin recognition complex, subunit 1 [Colletotrichum sp. CLE4]